MKKTYELVQVKVISLGNDDVITASMAKRNNSLLGQILNLGDYSVQDLQ